MEPLTLATGAVTAILTGAFTKIGEPLGSEVASNITKLVTLVKNKLRAEGTEGLLLRVEKEPSLESNIERLKAELATQISENQDFAENLLHLVAQIQSKSNASQQIKYELQARSAIELGQLRQESTGGSPINQFINLSLESADDKITIGDTEQIQ
jgi:SMC interacting uncharacterized protein involved in chromosome segregation